jgi:hypothetical protein
MWNFINNLFKMKGTIGFTKGQVVVCTKTQYYSCGTTRIREGAIVEVKFTVSEGAGYMHVFRRKDKKETIYIKTKNVRLATENEFEQFQSNKAYVNA